MADARLVVSELLCYIKNKFGKVDNKRLISLIFDFYDQDVISEARIMLINDVDELEVDNWVKPPMRIRRDSNSAPGVRTRQEIHDILTVFSFIDEQKLFDRIPRYVASNLSVVPTMKLEDGDIKCFLAKLEKVTASHDELNQNFLNLISYLSKFEDNFRALESLITDLSVQLNNTEPGSRVDLIDQMRDLAANLNEARAWSLNGNLVQNCSRFDSRSYESRSTTGPTVIFNDQCIRVNEVRTHDANKQEHRFDRIISESQQSQSQSEEEMTGVEEENRTGDDAGEFVLPRRRRRGTKRNKQMISPNSPDNTKRSQSGAVSYNSVVMTNLVDNKLNNSQSMAKDGNKAAKTFPRRDILVGQLAGNSDLKAHRSIQKKAIFFVGNVAGNYKFGDVISYVKKNMGIECLSCYDLSLKDNSDELPRNRLNVDQSNSKNSPSKAFRVCIKAADKQRFLDLSKWPKDILIRNWTFKSKVVNAEKIDKDSTQNAVGAGLSFPDPVMNVIRNVEIDVPETRSASDQGSSMWSDAIEELESGSRVKTCAIVHAANDSDDVQLYENVEEITHNL